MDELQAKLYFIKTKSFEKLTKPLVKDIIKVQQLNTSNKSQYFSKITPDKLTKLLKSVDSRKRTLMTIGKRNMTLTPNNIKEFIKNIDKFWVADDEVLGSDGEVVQTIKDVGSITLTRLGDNNKAKNEGDFFKYYNKTEIDLEEFAIYNSKPDDYNENCLVQSLIALNIDSLIVSGVKSMLCSKYVPTFKLTKICDKFNLHITIRKPNDKNLHKFGKKDGILIELGLIDQHYFAIKDRKSVV